MSILDFVEESEKKNVRENGKRKFYTVGYEGLGLVPFIALLKKNGVKTLVDVRYNAYSMMQTFQNQGWKQLLKRME